MFINYFKIAIRNLLNKKVYSGINLLGLSIAAAFCMLVFMYMQQERSFDRFHKNSDRLYRLEATNMFAFENENVVPDILLVAKAFGGGLPLGAFVSSQPIMNVLAKDPPLGHMTTFGGHPLCCAASLAAFEILEKDQLAKNSLQLGNIFKEKLSNHSAVKEVRGRGLMLAIELHDPAQLHPTVQRCKENGLLLDWFLFNDRSIRFYPPLVINEQEAEVITVKILVSLL